MSIQRCDDHNVDMDSLNSTDKGEGKIEKKSFLASCIMFHLHLLLIIDSVYILAQTFFSQNQRNKTNSEEEKDRQTMSSNNGNKLESKKRKPLDLP